MQLVLYLFIHASPHSGGQKGVQEVGGKKKKMKSRQEDVAPSTKSRPTGVHSRSLHDVILTVTHDNASFVWYRFNLIGKSVFTYILRRCQGEAGGGCGQKGGQATEEGCPHRYAFTFVCYV